MIAFFGLTLYAILNRNSFEICHGFLVVISFSIFPFFFFFLLFPGVITHMFIAVIGVIMCSFSIVIDTHLIIDGKYGLTCEDYVVAAILLFANIINLFKYILMIIGRE